MLAEQVVVADVIETERVGGPIIEDVLQSASAVSRLICPFISHVAYVRFHPDNWGLGSRLCPGAESVKDDREDVP
eukprot:827288-Rhodomonas_salina.3